MAENVAPTAVNIEEQPLSALKSSFNVSEYAPGESAPASATEAGPLAARLVDGKPVVRREAYVELAGVLAAAAGGDGSCFEEYAPLLKKVLLDNASTCHEPAIDIAAAIATHAPAVVAQGVASAAANALVEKHVAGKLQPKALDALLAFAAAGATDSVASALVKGSAHKVPKTRAAAAKGLAALLQGAAQPESLDLKAATTVVVGLIEHRDKAVRDEGLALLGALRLLRGDGFMKGELKGLTDAKLAELKETAKPSAAADADGGAAPARGAAATVAAAAAPAGAAGATPSAAGDASAAAAPPARPLVVEPFDLHAALPKAKWLKAVAGEKWGERKAAADQIVDLLADQWALVASDYSDIVRALKKLTSDANINVVSSSVRAMASLGRTLGKDGFGAHARKLAPGLLEKAADKKLGAPVGGALEAFTAAGCIGLADALEIAQPAVGDKNPLVQIAALKWLKAAAAATARTALRGRAAPSATGCSRDRRLVARGACGRLRRARRRGARARRGRRGGLCEQPPAEEGGARGGARGRRPPSSAAPAAAPVGGAKRPSATAATAPPPAATAPTAKVAKPSGLSARAPCRRARRRPPWRPRAARSPRRSPPVAPWPTRRRGRSLRCRRRRSCRR